MKEIFLEWFARQLLWLFIATFLAVVAVLRLFYYFSPKKHLICKFLTFPTH